MLRGAAWTVAILLGLAAALGGIWIYRGRTARAPAEIAKPAAIPPAAERDGRKSKPDDTEAAVELTFWNSIRDSSDPRLYREYLTKYPQGRFATLARLKLEPPPRTAPVSVSPPLPPPRPEVKADEYTGPLRGEMQWTGILQPGAALTIQGGKAAPGALTGDLPRVPSRVEIVEDGAGRNVSLVEAPSAANRWDRVVLRNGSTASVRSLQIRWLVER